MKPNQHPQKTHSGAQSPRTGAGLGLHGVINRRGGRHAAPRSDFVNDFLFLCGLFILLAWLAQWMR
ncbi:MAG: hypothetical protein RL095_3898 [Verrucomicrobiota bacterium]|jgi:hypothetical protein